MSESKPLSLDGTCVRQYEVRTIKNVDGNNKEREYVHVLHYQPKARKQVLEALMHRNSFSRGIADAALTALRDFIVEEMRMGFRVNIPEIGSFSLSAGVKNPKANADDEINDEDVGVTGINFRPAASLLHDISLDLQFVKTKLSAGNAPYRTYDEALEKIKEYLKNHEYLSVGKFSIATGYKKYTIRKLVKYFCEKGIMVKVGSDRSPVYMLK